MIRSQICILLISAMCFCACSEDDVITSDIKFSCRPRAGCDFSSCSQIPQNISSVPGFDEKRYLEANKHNLECAPRKEAMAALRGERGKKGERGPRGKQGHFGNFGPQGPEGRKGDTGDSGEKGEKGDTGLMEDVNKVDKEDFDRYKQEVEQKFAMLNDILNELQFCCNASGRSVEEPTTAPTTMKPISDTSTCVLIYHNKCFKLVGNSRKKARGTEEFRKFCAESGGKLADIYDRNHYDALVDKVRKKRFPMNIHLILGLKYDIFNKHVLLSNGTKLDFPMHWRPGNPTSYYTHISMQLYIDANPNEPAQGLYNRADDHVRFFAICEFEIA